MTILPQRVERREFQRLVPEAPIEARFDGSPARLVEVGVSGARVEHAAALPVEASARLSFEWEGETIELEAQIVRSEEAADGWKRSGVVFTSAGERAADALRRALSAAVSSRLRERRVEVPFDDPDDTLRPGDAQFIRYTFEEGVWKKRRAYLPEQPEDGFTVVLSEGRDDLQRLCRSWEQADAEGRRLLRLFCELSISDAMNVPRERN